MKNLSPLDKAAAAVILVVAVLIGVVILVAGQAGVRVTASSFEGGLIGPLQIITLTFSEPVDPAMAESLFDIQPSMNGTFRWVDSRTLQFASALPFELDTVYKLTLRSGVLSQEQHKLKNDLSWNFQVRPPLVAYLNTQNQQSSIWVTDLNNTLPQPLTDESVKVIGFDSSRDGEFIVFYSTNAQGGIDLWRVSRAGNDMAVLMDCGRDRCTAPAISPDGMRVAYSRELAGPGPDLPYGSPRVWVLDLQSGQNAPVYEDQQVLGYNPTWSPSGTQLASYDGLADQIRLLDMESGSQYIFPSNTGGPVTWSPEGTKFLFTEAEQTEAGIRTLVRMADLALNDSYVLIGSEDDMDYGYHSMIWSPVDASAVLLGMRAGGDDPAQVFWLFNPGRLDGIIIADQPDYAYNSPRWDVWGDSLVFQQFKLKGVYKPEIGVWSSGMSEPRVIAEGLMPHWLP